MAAPARSGQSGAAPDPGAAPGNAGDATMPCQYPDLEFLSDIEDEEADLEFAAEGEAEEEPDLEFSADLAADEEPDLAFAIEPEEEESLDFEFEAEVNDTPGESANHG